MLLMPSLDPPRTRECRDESAAADVTVTPSMVEGGSLRVRYIPGKASAGVTWKNRGESDLSGENSPLSTAYSDELKDSIPARPSKERKPYGFKQHVTQMIMSMMMVISLMGLAGVLVGVCIFILGVALPFKML